MKVLFIDIDGVLNTGRAVEDQRAQGVASSTDGPWDHQAVQNLNILIEIANCELVIASSWLEDMTFEEICKLFIKNGVIKKPISAIPMLPRIKNNRRGQEIKKWLSSHPGTAIEQYVIIDDEANLECVNVHQLHCVAPSPYRGLGAKTSIEEAMRILL